MKTPIVIHLETLLALLSLLLEQDKAILSINRQIAEQGKAIALQQRDMAQLEARQVTIQILEERLLGRFEWPNSEQMQ